MKVIVVAVAALTALVLNVGSHAQAKRTAYFTATAYCLRGTTATGTSTGYGVVAVDPRIIPLHRRMYVRGYGWGRALDTGSAIHDYRIDVWLPCRSAVRWGRRRVRVSW